MYFTNLRRTCTTINFHSKSYLSQWQSSRKSSSANPEYLTDESVQPARTALSYPREHQFNHIGLWYTIRPEMIKRLFHFYGLSNETREMHEIFRESCYMIREPALTILDYIKRSNLSHPINKYILYGRFGAGKTSILSYLLHNFAEEGWMILHVYRPNAWCTSFKEIVPSINRQGYYDHTQDAALWLQHFRSQNASLLQDPNLVTTESYQWTQRDTTEAGSPLTALVDFGISRARFASEVILCLTQELKRNAVAGRVKVALVIDGLNALFPPLSKYITEDKEMVPPSKFTLFEAFLNMLQRDWNNGVIIGTLDKSMSTLNRRESDLPRYLLGKKGWECVEPFVPIKVNDYTDREFESAVNYYIDRLWLQHPKGRTREGKQELSFLSGNNPRALITLVNGL